MSIPKLRFHDHPLGLDGFVEVPLVVGGAKTYCYPIMPGVSIRETFPSDVGDRVDAFAWPGRDGLLQVPCPLDPEDRCDSCIVECDESSKVFCDAEAVVAEGQFDSRTEEVPRANIAAAVLASVRLSHSIGTGEL